MGLVPYAVGCRSQGSGMWILKLRCCLGLKDVLEADAKSLSAATPAVSANSRTTPIIRRRRPGDEEDAGGHRGVEEAQRGWVPPFYQQLPALDWQH